MIKRPFFGFTKPKLDCPVPSGLAQEQMREAPLPGKVTLSLPFPSTRPGALAIKKGERVKTGEKVMISEEGEFIISTVAGTISDIKESTGYLGRVSRDLTIEVDEADERDETFKAFDKKDPLETARHFLNSLPGAADFSALLNPGLPLDTVVINAVDRDLLVNNNRFLLRTEIEALSEGAGILSGMLPGCKVVLAGPPESASLAEKIGVPVHVIQPSYPNTLPRLIMKELLGRVAPAGKGCEDVGVGFINAEAVAALGKAFSKGEIPVHKILTVITKEGKSINVRARIGTLIKELLDLLGIEVKHGDRLVLGGPMSGCAVFTEETPISADTEAVMIQDAGRITQGMDIPCVNCGECVRACPADIQVNMLIRLLENGLFEEATREYDLLSCIECGLCSYVCIARIPIFQYIMLGKSEFGRIQAAEESHA
ncbi:MAG: 4Fe-4S dicluster domain-containing protein [Pseudomonadota bacterium]